MTNWMIAVIAPRPQAAITTAQEKGGIASPTGIMQAKASSDVTASCTTVTRNMLTLPANRLMKIISSAIGTVLTSVIKSPLPNFTPSCGAATSSRPIKARTTPIQLARRGRRRRMIHCSTGTSGT